MLEKIIIDIGYWGILAVVFAESGLFFGFFLPGDSLLFIAGLLASRGVFPLSHLLIGSFIAAVLGDNVGYNFGKRVGVKLFTREDSVLFHKDHVARAQHFYEKYGKKAIVLARFVPIVRTFAPIAAGVGSMEYKTFFAYNVIGGLAWTAGFSLLGYFIGDLLPEGEKYFSIIIMAIIVISLIPAVLQHKQEIRSILSKLRKK